MRPPRRAAALAVALVAGCVAPYREREPEIAAARPRRAETPAKEASARARPPDDEGRTVIGYVAADGTLHADTLAGAQPDTARVERETVVTGAFGPPADPVAAPLAAPERVAAGYRVQVFASGDRLVAHALARRVEGRLPGESVTVEWDEPWYKVRVGDFSDRGEAEGLRLRLVEMGFGEAWIVPAAFRPGP